MNSDILCISIPINDVLDHDIFNVQLFYYIDINKKFPKREKIIDHLNKLYKKNKDDYWKECINTLNLLKSWPHFVKGIIDNGTEVINLKYGGGLFECSIIEIFNLK